MIKGISGVGTTAAERGRLLEISSVLREDRTAAIVLGGAHTLAFADGAIVGDPLEKQSFEGIKFT